MTEPINTGPNSPSMALRIQAEGLRTAAQDHRRYATDLVARTNNLLIRADRDEAAAQDYEEAAAKLDAEDAAEDVTLGVPFASILGAMLGIRPGNCGDPACPICGVRGAA